MEIEDFKVAVTKLEKKYVNPEHIVCILEDHFGLTLEPRKDKISIAPKQKIVPGIREWVLRKKDSILRYLRWREVERAEAFVKQLESGEFEGADDKTMMSVFERMTMQQECMMELAKEMLLKKKK